MASTSEELFDAIEAGNVERVRSLLGADPSLATARDDAGMSAILRARYRFDHALVAAIREHVDDLDAAEAAALGDLDRLTTLLDSDPSLIEARTPDGFALLHLAAFFAGVDAVTLLLARGADVDARGTGWMTGTALHSAASARDATSVRALLDAGADPTLTTDDGRDAYAFAEQSGDAATIALLPTA